MTAASHLDALTRRCRLLASLGLALLACGSSLGCEQLASTDAPKPTAQTPAPETNGARYAEKSPAASAVRPSSTTNPHAWPSPPTGKGRYLSMRDAKKTLRKLYRRDGMHTLYTNCAFDDWRIDWSQCCYQPQKAERKRLEWEHVVPASTFGRHLPSWKKGDNQCRNQHGPFKGRRCARRASQSFREMEADMHNLFPTVGEINEERAYYPMAIIEGEARNYGSCDFEIQNKRVEPRPGARGEVARAYLYMHWRYPSYRLLDADGRQLMQQWHHADPPDSFERTRNKFIAQHQDISNPWIE